MTTYLRLKALTACVAIGLLGGVGCSSERGDGPETESATETTKQRLWTISDDQLFTANSNLVRMCWWSYSAPFGYNGVNWDMEKAFIKAQVASTWAAVAAITVLWSDCTPDDPTPYVRINLNTAPADATDSRGITGGASGDCYAPGKPETAGIGMSNVTTISNNPRWCVEWGFSPDWLSSPANVTRAQYVVIHEFGHILGFNHENDRGDRSNVYACSPANQVTSPYWTSFGLAETQYDESSVMNYCAGNQNRLTATDIAGVRQAYGARWTYGHDDVNADGWQDLFWYNSSTHASQIWMLNSEGRIGRLGLTPLDGGSTVVGPPWMPVGHSDFDGDHNPDLLWYNTSDGSMQVWTLVNGFRILRRTVTYSNGAVAYIKAPWSIVATDDFNQDGHPDILWHNSTTQQNQIWYMNGTTQQSTRNISYASGADAVSTSAWAIVSTGDFNRDGFPDLLWHNDGTGETVVNYLGGLYGQVLQGTAYVTYGGTTSHVFSPWSIRGVQDYNDDGWPDILWYNSSTGNPYLWIMNGKDQVGLAEIMADDLGGPVNNTSGSAFVFPPWGPVPH